MFILKTTTVLLKCLKVLILITHIIHEVLDVPVLHDLLVEEILPYSVELELASLNLAIDRFNDVYPEFFKVLETVT
jgi:hypothetical protein